MTPCFDFSPLALPQLVCAEAARALANDVGSGDLTAGLTAPGRQAHANVLAHEPAAVCGAASVEAAILQLAPPARLGWDARERARFETKQISFEVGGQGRALPEPGDDLALNRLSESSGKDSLFAPVFIATNNRI